MADIKKNIFEKKFYIAVFLILMGYFGIRFLLPLNYTPRVDDSGPLIYPAYLAGKDWHLLTQHMRFYYGFGYYWIFAPVFWLTDRFSTIIFSIVSINYVIMALIGVLIYHILVRYMKMEQGLIPVFLTCILTTFMRRYPGDDRADVLRTDNEIPLFIGIWILIYLLAKLFEEQDKVKRRWLSVFAGIVVVWTLTVHERALSLLIGFVLTVFIAWFFGKKKIVEPLWCGGAIIVSYIAYNLVQKNILEFFLGLGTGAKVSNTDALKGASLWFLSDFTSIKAFVSILVGNLHGIVFSTYGLCFFAFAAILIWLWKNRFVFRKKDPVENLDFSMLLMIMFGAIVAIVILGIALRWGSRLAEDFTTGAVTHQYKAITYLRYYYSFLGPLVLGTIGFLYERARNNVKKDKALIVLSFLGIVGTELLFGCWVMHRLVNVASDYIRRSVGLRFWDSENYWNYTMNEVFVLVVFLFIVWNSNYKRFLYLMSAWFLVLLIGLSVRLQPAKAKFVVKDEEALLQLVDSAEEKGIDLKDHFYVVLDAKAMVRIQFTVEKYACKSHEDLNGDEQALIISNGKKQSLIEAGYQLATLSKGCYAYAKEDLYNKLLAEYGE